MTTNGENAYENFKAAIGADEGAGDWYEITQERINQFADATDDHQFIHVDPEACAQMSPWGVPIAHGFLTLSLLPKLMQEAMDMPTVKMGVNYGLNKVRFTGPVPVGSRLRAQCKLLKVERLPALPTNPDLVGAQVTMEVTIEREGSDRPVCIAESI